MRKRGAVIDRSEFLRGAALGVAGVALAPAGRAAAADSFTCGFVPSTLFAPVFVAAYRGYFAPAGSVDLTPIVAGQDSMALLAQGQLDFVAAGLSAAFFNAVNRGLEVRFVASTAYQPETGHPTALMVRQDLYDAGDRSVATLKGKKVGWLGGAGATSAYYVAVMLRQAGLSLSDIDSVNISAPNQGVALERKAIDAVFAASPFTEEFAARKLSQMIATPPAGISATGIFYGPRLLRDKKSGAAILDAARRGAAEIQGAAYYRPENLAAFAKYTQQPLDVLRKSARYDFPRDLRIDLATLTDMQKVFLGQGILAYKSPLDDARLIARF